MTVIKSPHGIFDPSGMIVAKDGTITAEFAEQIRNLVHAELAKLEEPMEAHIAGEITRQLDERKHAAKPAHPGLKPGMEVK